jgi:hypothetical protein
MKRQFIIATLTTLFCTFQTNNVGIVHAQTISSTPNQNNEIQIDVTDITSNPPLIQNINGQVTSGGVNGQFTGGSINYQIKKTITNVWKMPVDASKNANDFTIQYELNSLNNLSISNSKISISEIKSINPQIITDGTSSFLTDDIEFNFDLSQVRGSGNYSGKLTVSVTEI